MRRADGPRRRSLLIGLATVGLAPLAGCMTKPLRTVNADHLHAHYPDAHHRHSH